MACPYRHLYTNMVGTPDTPRVNIRKKVSAHPTTIFVFFLSFLFLFSIAILNFSGSFIKKKFTSLCMITTIETFLFAFMNHRSIPMIIHHVIQLASYIPVNIILKMIVTCHEHVTRFPYRYNALTSLSLSVID